MKNKIFIATLVLLAAVRWWEVQAKVGAKFEAGEKIEFKLIRLERDLVPDWSGNYRWRQEGLFIEGKGREVLTEGTVVEVSGRINERVIKGQKKQIYLKAEQIKVYKTEKGWRGYFIGMRNTIKRQIRRWLPPDSADLAMGVVWGDREGLDRKTVEAFRNSGLSHLLVASGFNVTLLAGAAAIITERYMRKKWAVVVSIFCTVLYAFVIGMEIPVLRAVALFSLAQMGVWLGRRTQGGYVLVVVAMIFIILTPAVVESLSFWLSFLATAGLVVAPKAKNYLLGLVYQNVSVIIMIAPVLVSGWGTLQLAGIPANLLVEPFIPVISGLTLAAVLVGMVVSGLGKLLAYLAWPFLEYISAMAVWWGNLKLNPSGLPALPTWMVGPYYLAVYLLLVRKKTSWNW